MTTSAEQAPGDLRLFDNDVPALDPGTYHVEVEHSLDHAGTAVAPETLTARQSFVVSAPQFRIDPALVRSVYPPAESSGGFGTVLPYVVLDDPLLPFERPMPGSPERLPWLALLVFQPGELSGGTDSPTATTTATVGEFLTARAGRRIPAVTPAPDVSLTDPVSYISVPAKVFRDVAPRLHELRFLAHCRQAAATDQPASAAQGRAGAEALVGVVMANRFPAPPKAGAPAVRTIAHLVSLEGHGPLLDGSTALADTDSVEMVSLSAWSFWSFDDGRGDFESLAQGLVSDRRPGPPEVHGAHSEAGRHGRQDQQRQDQQRQQGPADLLLRLPVPPAGSDPAHREVADRLACGYVPLEYRTPTGEATFAWYRGPLGAVPGTAAPRTFPSADAARVYDPAFGVFDLSLAAAWQAGRAAALADPAFGRLLLDFRRRTHTLVDALYQRLVSDHFSAARIAELDASASAQHEFLAMLTAQLLAEAGRGPQPDEPPPPAPGGSPPPPDADPRAALHAFLAEPEIRGLILAAVRDDLEPIAGWLARLLLLEQVPFTHLVADEGLLPAESVRLAYVDPAWQDAMVDGALSLGIESSLKALYASLTGDLVRGAAREALLVRRSGLLGLPPAKLTPPRSGPGPAGPKPADPKAADPKPAPNPPDTVPAPLSLPMTALLLRSALVTGWPDLAVRARNADGSLLPALRVDRLSPSVLLCLFPGVPASVTLGEPPHGLRFGVEDSGRLPLRNPAAGRDGGPALGAVLTGAAPVPVLDPQAREALALRDVRTRVLNLEPADPASLVGRLAAALAAAVPDPARVLGPADVALQLVKAPEALFVGAPNAG